MRKTELLIPAGSLDTLKTAVIYGADAVYLGSTRFGARAYAEKSGVDFLGEIPIVQSIMEGAEEGRPATATHPEVEERYRSIAEKIVSKVMKNG